ncbi:MAG: DUF2345 domain-containing protein, partial [Fulvimonas sp.]|nr:DUF2345 domain-containing protein [Fulvimonas sp.]
AIANHGPVSLEAHTDTLQLLADASVTLTSTQARIDILAQRRIVLQAGASTLTLEGKDITFACPGQFLVKSQVHAWMGPERLPATLDPLPDAQPDLQRKYRLSR